LFEKCHADCIQYHNGYLYITIQEIENNGFIYIINIDDENKLSINKKINGFSFPHGLNINFNLIGITEYDDSSITIEKLEFLLEK